MPHLRIDPVGVVVALEDAKPSPHHDAPAGVGVDEAVVHVIFETVGEFNAVPVKNRGDVAEGCGVRADGALGCMLDCVP